MRSLHGTTNQAILFKLSHWILLEILIIRISIFILFGGNHRMLSCNYICLEIIMLPFLECFGLAVLNETVVGGSHA